MQSKLLSLLAFSITALAAPNPTPPSTSPTPPPFSYAPLTFTFHGGPASYTLNFAADGQTRTTGSNLSISLISIGSFSAYSLCNFYGPNYKWITGIVQQGDQLVVGPPQVIEMVQCANWPGGASTCLPEYSDCEWDSNQGGEFMLPCCGFCAADKCRSFDNPP